MFLSSSSAVCNEAMVCQFFLNLMTMVAAAAQLCGITMAMGLCVLCWVVLEENALPGSVS